MYYSIAT